MIVLQPEGWTSPVGYSNGVLAEGRMVFVAGQIGWNGQQEFVTDDFAGQAEQALRNVVDVLAVAGGAPGHITRMTWYVVDKHEYLACQRELGAAYRKVIGNHFPSMSLVQVAGLLEDRAKVEVEATAVLPAG